MVWIIISSILLVVLAEWISTNIGFPKLKFSSFKKFYTLNPDRWGFGDGYFEIDMSDGESSLTSFVLG